MKKSFFPFFKISVSFSFSVFFFSRLFAALFKRKRNLLALTCHDQRRGVQHSPRHGLLQHQPCEHDVAHKLDATQGREQGLCREAEGDEVKDVP